jgi:hypothetical protein
MEDSLLLVVPFKLALIMICDDFKDIRKGLTPTSDTFPHTLETWVQGKKSPCTSKPLFHFKTGLAKSTVKRMPKDFTSPICGRRKSSLHKIHSPTLVIKKQNMAEKATKENVGRKDLFPICF